MKTLSIVTASIALSILMLGSIKPIMPTVKMGRAPALEKTYKPLKSSVNAYLVSVSR